MAFHSQATDFITRLSHLCLWPYCSCRYSLHFTQSRHSSEKNTIAPQLRETYHIHGTAWAVDFKAGEILLGGVEKEEAIDPRDRVRSRGGMRGRAWARDVTVTQCLFIVLGPTLDFPPATHQRYNTLIPPSTTHF